jgi:hypothetical protein
MFDWDCMRRKKLIYERVQCEAIDSETARILSRTRAYVAQPPADITSLSVKRSAQQSRREREREKVAAQRRELSEESHIISWAALKGAGKERRLGWKRQLPTFPQKWLNNRPWQTKGGKRRATRIE